MSTVTFVEYLGSETSTATPTQLDMVSTIAANSDRSTYPISVGNYSYSKVFRLKFDGTFTNISQIKIYKESGDYLTGEVVNYGSSSTYHVATGGDHADSVAITALPTSLPSTANITIGGSLAGSLTASGTYSDYIYLQSSVTIQAIAATSNEKTLVATWTEA